MLSPAPTSVTSVELLRAATSEKHQTLDRHLSRRLDADADAAVSALVRAAAQIVPATEAALRSLTWPPALQISNRLCKSAWLASDLGDVSGADVVRIEDLAFGWGCLYTIEGSTLGAKTIRSRARDRARHSRYLQGYGTATGPMWREFVHLLNQGLVTNDDRTRAAVGANATFDAFILALGAA